RMRGAGVSARVEFNATLQHSPLDLDNSFIDWTASEGYVITDLRFHIANPTKMYRPTAVVSLVVHGNFPLSGVMSVEVLTVEDNPEVVITPKHGARLRPDHIEYKSVS